MRLFDLIKTANSNISKAKLRSFLTILAVFIGAFTLSLTTALGSGVNSYINQQLGNIGGDNLISISVKPPEGTANPLSNEPQEYKSDQRQQGQFGIVQLTNKDVEKIKSYSGLSGVTPQYMPQIDYITQDNQSKYTIMISQYSELDVALAAGNLIKDDDKNSILLQKKYLDSLGFDEPQAAVGQTVTLGYKDVQGQLQTKDLTVVGVLEDSLIGSNSLLSVDAVKDIASVQGGAANYIAINAQLDPSLDEAQVSQLQQQMSEDGYMFQTLDEVLGQVSNVITSITIGLGVFGVIVLLAAALGVVNTLLMAVKERTREIGLMKALGMNRSGVFAIFAFEAIALGFWGAALGVLASYGVGKVLNQIASSTFLQGLPGFEPFTYPLLPMLAIIFGVMLLAFLAGVLPSFKASRQDPIEALRYE